MTNTNFSDISRRQLLKAMAVAGATIGAWSLAGCSARTEGTSAQGSSSNTSKSETDSTPTETNATSTETNATSAETSTPTQASGNTLVAVFSWSGNTLGVANRVVEDLQGQAELFRIEPATPYTTDYDEMLQIAQDEQAANTMPAIAGAVSNWNEYATVYLGFPTWWGHLPQIVKSFLAEHDCSGKVVYPFNTHAGSGFASCLSDLAEACPNADIREGLSLVGEDVSSSTAQIDDWVSKNA